MTDTPKLRLYDTNLMLARELKPGAELSLQLCAGYPYVGHAVRVIHDRTYSRPVMPSSYIAFGFDILGFLPERAARLTATRLQEWEERHKADPEHDAAADAALRLVKIDRWGAAVVSLSGALFDGIEDDADDEADFTLPQPEV